MIDLQEMEKYRENNRIEAKLAAGGFPHSLWETYSAFANTIGGLILLGVEEAPDKVLHVSGLPHPQDYVEQFWKTVNDPKQVSANIMTREQVSVRFAEGRQIVVIEVPRAHRRQRPVYLGDSPFNGSYRRDGEGDYRCTDDEVRAMLRDRGDTPQDLAPLEELPVSALRTDTLRQFRLLMAVRFPDHPWNRLTDEQFLPAAGALVPDGGSLLRPTVAGLLMFGSLPDLTRTFPGYRLEYREEQTGFLLLTGQGTWSGNLFDFYARVSRRMTVRGAAELARTQASELASAFREAAVNALIHSDYFGGQGLEIVCGPDGLQVTNSGLLRVSPECARTGCDSDPRNPVLTRLFSLIGVRAGTGRGLKGIYALWSQQGWSAPILEESFRAGTTSLSLPLAWREATPGDRRRQQIAEFLTEAISATTRQISDGLHLSPTQVRRYLDQLVDAGLVLRSREKQSVRYSLRA